MEKTNPGIQKRVDPNSISLRRYRDIWIVHLAYREEATAEVHRNSNIISKYRHQKEKLYKEVVAMQMHLSVGRHCEGG